MFEISVTQNSVATGKRSSGYITNESEDKRLHRLEGFFGQKGLTLYSVGNLLAAKVDGKSIAARMAEDNTYALPMASISINGQSYQLREGFVLSIDTCRTPTNADGLAMELPPVWGCLGCGSAHGSGIAPSKGKPKQSGLESNQFFYCVQTRDLFVISNNCYKSYVTDAGRSKSIKVAPKVAVAK